MLLADRSASITSDQDLDALAHGIADRGIAASERAVRCVADAAARRGACPVLVGLVTDRGAPQVARERAFGRLAAILASRLPAESAPDLLCA